MSIDSDKRKEFNRGRNSLEGFAKHINCCKFFNKTSKLLVFIELSILQQHLTQFLRECRVNRNYMHFVMCIFKGKCTSFHEISNRCIQMIMKSINHH